MLFGWSDCPPVGRSTTQKFSLVFCMRVHRNLPVSCKMKLYFRIMSILEEMARPQTGGSSVSKRLRSGTVL